MAERSNASEIISSLGAPVLFRDELWRDPTESTEIRDEDRGVSGKSGRAPAADDSPADGSRSRLTWSTRAGPSGDEETSPSSTAIAMGSPPPTDEPRGSDGEFGADPCWLCNVKNRLDRPPDSFLSNGEEVCVSMASTISVTSAAIRFASTADGNLGGSSPSVPNISSTLKLTPRMGEPPSFSCAEAMAVAIATRLSVFPGVARAKDAIAASPAAGDPGAYTEDSDARRANS
jgi:hypothetical protein